MLTFFFHLVQCRSFLVFSVHYFLYAWLNNDVDIQAQPHKTHDIKSKPVKRKIKSKIQLIT